MAAWEISFGLLLVALLIALIAKRLDHPYPIALVLGGIGLALIPGMPTPHLEPEIVFLLLLPPVLFEAAYFTSWRDFLRWRRSILMLAFGLVAATSAAVAAVCVYLIPGMNWATGFVLGAIVSPPDAAAATSIMRGLGLPRRVVQVLEGESLVNDASGLTIYRFAVAAIVTGSFSAQSAGLAFLWIAIGGVAIGIAFGIGYVKVFPLLKDPEVEVLSGFLLAYLSYFVAEAVHASGVLACVTAGLILGRKSPELLGAITRIRSTAVWSTVIFLFNVIIFLLIGLQLPSVVASLGGYPPLVLAGWGVAVSIVVMAVRLAWVFPGEYLPLLFPFWRRHCTEFAPDRAAVFVVGWTGLRGIVSLAAAIGLPVETASGMPFPYRDLLIFLTFAVILSTLLFQGLTLRPLIRLLRLPEDRSSEEEALQARLAATEAALARLSEIRESTRLPEASFERVRLYFEDRLADTRARLEIETGSGAVESPDDFSSIGEQRLWWEMLRAQRTAVVQLRREARIGDEALHEVEREFDLLEARIVPR